MAPSTTSASLPAGQPGPQSQTGEPQRPQPALTTQPTPDLPGPQSEKKNEKEKHYASIIPDENDERNRLALEPTLSAVSTNHDMQAVAYVPTGDNDERYNTFTPRRKAVIVAVVSFCSFLAPISSTTVLSAVPEVAATFGTDGSVRMPRLGF